MSLRSLLSREGHSGNTPSHLAVSARGSADVEEDIKMQVSTPHFSEGAGNLMDYPDPPRAGPEQSRL
jgi:hypothetical protein